MLLRLIARPAPSRAMLWLAPVFAIVLTLAAGAAMFLVLGQEPQAAFWSFFVKPVSSLYGIGELILKATPLILIGLGLSIGFRANVWNIGAEGQLIIGAIAGSGLAIAYPEGAGLWLLPAVLLAGTAGGLAWAAIPAFLKTRFNANEILTSLMLTYVASLLLAYLVYGPWRDPDGFNFPQSAIFDASATLPLILGGTRLHLGILLVPLAVAGIWFLLARGHLGFQVTVAGQAPAAASFAGYDAKRITWISLLISGGLAGLAGVMEVAGPIGQLLPVISPGYGFTAIIVAFLGRLHPLGILFAGLLMALTFLGAETVQIDLGLPLAVAGVFQGMLLFFLLACDVTIRYRLAFGRHVAEAG